MTYINLTIVEIPKPLLMGLKVNKETLVAKNKSITDVANIMRLTEKFVIGYDESLSLKSKPHYHIHFLYDGTLGAIQKFKQRNLKDWGTSTKLYEAKDKKDSDPYAWYGYAVKENEIYVSPDIDKIALDINAHTQHAFKRSKMEYGNKIEVKKVNKQTTEDKIFIDLDEYIKEKGRTTLREIMARMAKTSLEEFKSMLSIQRLEYLGYKYLLLRKKLQYSEYVNRKLDNDKSELTI